MTPLQKEALRHLGSLTELGRAGEHPESQVEYKPRGKSNGIMLFQMGVTDADMKYFDVLPEFHFITVRECPVSDVGLRHLRNHHQLQRLDIGETAVTSLHPLRNAVGLQVLWCDQLESLTDRKAAALGGFPELRFLDLSWTGIADLTAKRLTGTRLTKLKLIGTKITDEGLRHIGQIDTLEMLSLYRTEVGDAGLRHLHGLPRLRILAVGNTAVTPQGRKAIQRAIPGLKVSDYESIY